MSRLLEEARQALSRGESSLAVELLESARTMDDERVTPRLVSTLLVSAKAAMQTSVPEAIELYRRTHRLDPRALKPRTGLMLALVKRSHESMGSGELSESLRFLSEALGIAQSEPKSPVEEIVSVRLIAALRVFGEKCLQDGDEALVLGAAALLARGVDVLGPVDGDEPSLLWLAASLALVGGEVSGAHHLALKAEQEDPHGYSLTEIDQSQLPNRVERGTRVLTDGDSEKMRQRVRWSVVASPARTVFVTPEAPTDADQSAAGINPSAAALWPGQFFALARDLSDESIEELERLLPEVFAIPIAAVEMRSVYEFVLVLRLALRELPKLTAFLSDTARRKAHAVVVDPLLNEAGLRTLLEQAGLEIPEGGLDIRYSAQGPLPVISAPANGAGLKAELALKVPKGGALVVVGSDVELPFLRPISEILAEDGPVTFLGKEDTERAARALAGLADLGEVIDAESMRELTWAKEEITAPPRSELLKDRFGLLEPKAQGFVRVHFSAMLSLDRTSAGFSEVVRALEPYAVVGSLDRSVFGVLAMQLSRRDGFRTINLQHGTVMPSRTSDLLRFDLSLAWNEWSRDLMVKDGYPEDAPIEIVGNPRWDRLGMIGADELGSRRAELAAWKGADYLAVMFPQPPKGPFLDPGSIETVYRWVERWAAERSDVKILVKGRPAADDPDPPETLKSAAFFRSVSSDEITIEEVLTFADVAVSGYSTALLDAAAATVPAVSADPGGVLGALPLDVLVAAKPCVSYQEFAKAMNRAITDRHLVLGGIPTAVLPEFEHTYQTRVNAVLREHGLLNQPAVP